MKHKIIEKTEPKKLPNGYGKKYGVTAQMVGDVIVLNAYNDIGKLYVRHCVDTKTGEYSSFRPGAVTVNGQKPGWSDLGIACAITEKSYYDTYYRFYDGEKYDRMTALATKEDEKLVSKAFEVPLRGKDYKGKRIMNRWRNYCENIESKYNKKQAIAKEERRLGRVNEVMDLVGDLPEDFLSWAQKTMFSGVPGTASYAGNEEWFCSECHEKHFRKEYIPLEEVKKVKADALCKCPSCGALLRMRRKGRNHYTPVYTYGAQMAVMQPLNERYSVVRYIDVTAKTDPMDYPEEPGKKMRCFESVRVVIDRERKGPFKNGYGAKKNERPVRIFYENYGRFDDRSNPHNRSMGDCYLYPDKKAIIETLSGSVYEKWARTFCAFAAKGTEKVDYNACMAAFNGNLPDITELLYKGRFYRLTSEFLGMIDHWSGTLSEWRNRACEYGGDKIFNDKGKNIHEVLGLKDMQLINRLRDINGDTNVLSWLRYSEDKKTKLSQDFILWARIYGITVSNCSEPLERLTPEKLMNYVKKQAQLPDGYIGYEYSAIISQYTDYLKMAHDLGKKLKDEMIFKPTNLKLRHNEYVEECRVKREMIRAKHDKEYAQKQKKELNMRFPTAKEILKEIKPKFEWENKEYKIIVPKDLTDIIFEGQQLHHCAGATDRYFDRITQRETFIVFLREKKNVGTPFYTIEVEPGGAIRQHRGMYDEEPNIEKVKPALKEWQKEIRKRMKEEDHKAAEISKKKRAENLEELRTKNNLKVLNALLEDFMDSEDEEEPEKEKTKTA